MKRLARIFPLLESLEEYSSSDFRNDLIAGLTVGIMLVPQGMAYAYLAGLPPIYGLYGGLVPLFIYALFGTSRQLSIGPVAISVILVLAGVSQFATPETPEYISLVILCGLMIGICQILFSLLRLGFLVKLLSHPVIAGFTSAAAVIIAVSQLKDVLGFDIPRYSYIHQTITYAWEHIGETNILSVIFSVVSLATMLTLRSINRAIPGALIVVVVGTLLSWGLSLGEQGLAIIRDVPAGLPAFEVPNLDFANMKMLLPVVLTVTVIGIVESIGIAKALEAKHKSYKIRPNQELFALGFSKLLGSFFQSLPTSGSFSRSAINNEAGAKTGISSMITASLILLVLLFLTSAFYHLPKAILAAIILLAVRSLFEWKEAIHLWQISKRDFWVMIITFLGTLILGIEPGVLLGVFISLSLVIFRTARKDLSLITGLAKKGKLKGDYSQEKESGTLTLQFNQQLYFANSEHYLEEVQKAVEQHSPGLSKVILDGSEIYDIDSSGLETIREIHSLLNSRNLILGLSGFHENWKEQLESQLLHVHG